MAPDHDSFDPQAASFDERAGLPADACRQIAEVVVELVGPEAALLEIGAGTGAIGCELCRLLPAYTALDSAPGMLDVFAGRLGDSACDCLVVGDAAQRWPVADRSQGGVFGSRALHLLDAAHVIAELDRVLVPGGVLLVGRVERAADDPRERLRREMRKRLSGLTRTEPRQRHGLVAALVERGAEAIERHEAAGWTARWTPREVLEAWRRRQPLSGVALDPDARHSLLSGLERWVEAHLGGLDVPFGSEPTYTLEGVRLHDAT
jgi:ubiquinone/menaquinone biosynthesis C-methylase UbiE